MFQHFLRCSPQSVVDHVGDLMNARPACFDRPVREEPPELPGQLTPDAHRALSACADDLKDWPAGDHARYPQTRRHAVGA
ncbi:hypothetical protein ABT263_26650 [Kitasatospora sp. NPDC001603]|uniref:hypothetical protein n=1 Tax=Kitasatospora sp. NPDC001603 TaxID=3154388 RepID=UPI0033235895